MSSLNLGTGVVSPSSGAYVWPAPDLIKIRLVCRRLIFIHHAIWCWGIFTKSISITCSQLPPLGVTHLAPRRIFVTMALSFHPSRSPTSLLAASS